MPNPIRQAAGRVIYLTTAQGRSADDPVVIAARQEHALVSIRAHIAKVSAGVPIPDAAMCSQLIRDAWAQ